MDKIDYNDIKALFFDVGNTLMSMDYEMVCKELERNGIFCDAGILQRTDAAARPLISSEVNNIKKDPSVDERVFLFTRIIEQLPIEIIYWNAGYFSRSFFRL